MSSAADSEVSSAPSPASRLRLSVPVVSHTQIDVSDLVDLLRESPLSGSYGPTTVLDVRGADNFAGGSTKGSVHIPFEELESAAGVDALIARLAEAKTRRLIVLDLGGRQQASVVAELVLAKLKAGSGSAASPESAASPSGESAEPQVFVLTSGFTGVLNEHVDISADRSKITLKQGADSLIQDFDAARWVGVAVPRTPSNADLPNSQNQLVYKANADSAHVFVSTPK